MSNLPKLKKRALDYEQKKQFDKALEVYAQILAELDEHVDEADVALYNRAGDLLLRRGDVSDAVDHYEKAVDLYTEGGFFNNAIALCNKILRNAPGRNSIYYKLGKISARKGFINDAKQNFLEYADRMQKAGQLEEAFRALKEFADLCPDQDDIRLMLADQLVRGNRKTEAVEQLQKLYEKFSAEGRTREARAAVDRMKALDPTLEPKEASSTSAAPKRGDLVFLDVNYDEPLGARGARASAAPASTSDLPLIEPPAFEPTKAPPSPVADDAPLAMEEPLAMAPPPATEQPILAEETGAAEAPLLSALDASLVPGAPSADEITIEPLAGLSHGSMFAEPEVDTTTNLVSHVDGGFITGFEETTLSEAGADATELLEDALADFEGTVLPGAEVPTPDAPAAANGADTLEAIVPALDEDLGGDLPLIDVPFDGADAMPDESGIGDAEGMGGDLTLIYPDDPPSPPAAPAAAARSGVSTPADVPIIASADIITFDEPDPLGVAAANGHGDALDLDELELRQGSALDEVMLPATPEPEAVDGAEREPEAPTVEHLAPNDAGGLDFDFLERLATPAAGAPAAAAAPAPVADESPPAPAATITTVVHRLSTQLDAHPGDWELHRRLGEALLEDGDRHGGLQELESAMLGLERDGELRGAMAVAEELIRIEPSSVRHHQKCVEYAVRLADQPRLAEAYLALADCLFRAGQLDKSRAVYHRVVELAPDDERAVSALRAMGVEIEPEVHESSSVSTANASAHDAFHTPAPRAELEQAAELVEPAPDLAPTAAVEDAANGAGGSFVNLSEWLREDESARSTRMVTEEPEPQPEGDVDFTEMLTKFKQGVAANVEETDHESHYDLGIAYKEMGLLDEAISEFQKALRGTENRARTYEALGQCFVEKRQYQIALTILARALADKDASDDTLVGVLYLLGYASEALSSWSDALRYYERVFAVDIRFRDVGDRLAAVERRLR